MAKSGEEVGKRMESETPGANDLSHVLALRADHRCFGCGAQNPIGLHLRFSEDEDGVRAPFVPGRDHQGFEDVIHGGIISTVLDEAMAWATAAAGIWAVTGEMRVRFRHVLKVGEPATIRARVTSRRGRLITTAAELTLDTSGAVIASGTATFMQVDPATEAAWRSRYLIESGP
jgi:acyl-coenzyme A thioesterase PaaI-like protein